MDELLGVQADEEERDPEHHDELDGSGGLEDVATAARELHASLREQVAHRPYVVLGAACGVGLLLAAQRSSVRGLVGAALASGLKAVVATALEGRIPVERLG